VFEFPKKNFFGEAVGNSIDKVPNFQGGGSVRALQPSYPGFKSRRFQEFFRALSSLDVAVLIDSKDNAIKHHKLIELIQYW